MQENFGLEGTNTFQCILTSNGLQSFVIFLYADGLIQWTTGDASGGSGGLGGTAAQVGFNAGDGIRFASVPDSRTPDIINIASTSNVGQGGVWIFRVDEEDIIISDCDNSAPLQTAPRVGNQLGGTPIFLAGPCFNPEDTITCTFDGSIQVSGSFISMVLAVCVSPFFDSRGWKELEVVLQRASIYMGNSQFYAVSFEDSADIGFNELPGPSVNPSLSPMLHFIAESRVLVTWDPDSLFPMSDPNSYVVDIALSQLNLNTGIWERLQTLASEEENDGMAEVDFPSVSGGPMSMDDVAPIVNDTHPVSIEVVVASMPTVQGGVSVLRGRRQTGSSLLSIVGFVKRWTPIAFFTRVIVGVALRAACELWCSQQPDGIGEDILSRVPPCPRTVAQARAPNSGFTEDAGAARFLSQNFFHRGAESCFRQTTFNDPNVKSGQQCCYDSDGTLLVGPPAGGTVDLVSPELEISRLEHFIDDVIPAIACCTGLFSNCDVYYEKRPSDDGSRFNPPPPACVYGDPHIVTLDGFKYTFNGLGEYTLIETLDNRFTIQARMEIPTGGTLPPGISATVFTAIVAREASSDIVQIQLTSDGQSLEMLLNGVLVDFSDLSDLEFINVTVSDRGNDTLAVTFSTGIYIEVREANGIISTLLVSLSRDYEGETLGLMGNFNNDTSDDLLPRGETIPIPLASSLEDIHFLFGVTWIIGAPEDSLFTYQAGTSFDTFHSPDFTPTFSPSFSDPDLEAEAVAMCEGDPFCLFDVAATGSTEIGLSTLQGGVELEMIVSISAPVSCSPPCENGVCFAEDMCSCSSGFEGAGCVDPIFTPCEMNPCENGGSCLLRAGSHICTCPPDFSGIQCQIEVMSMDFVFERDSYEIMEDIGFDDLALRVCINNLNVSTERTITVSTSSGTAQGGEDYEELSRDIVFAIGDGRLCIAIIIFEDTAPEMDEYFDVNIEFEGVELSSRVTIEDDDDTELRFIGNTPMVNGGVVVFSILFIGEVESAMCALITRNRVQEETDCTSGVAEFTTLNPRNSEFTPRITIRRPGDIEEIEISDTMRNIRLGVRGRCSVHLINEGITTDDADDDTGMVTEFEWDLSAPSDVIREEVLFQCSLDNNTSNACQSPFRTGVLSSGPHTLAVSVSKTGGCVRGIRRTFVFQAP